MIFVQKRQIVVPGEILAEGDYLSLENTYRRDSKIISKILGVVEIEGKGIKLIPLAGRYLPKRGDLIIGRIIDITPNGWRVEFNSPYLALLNMKDISIHYIRKGEDLSRTLDIGDYILAKISNATPQGIIDLTMKEPGLKKLKEGRIVKINPHKVPRLIGKKGSMIALIKEKTKTEILAGQNGLVCITGNLEGRQKAEQIIKLIERKAHLEGLTEEISQKII